MNETVLISLGRFGDLCNSLGAVPILTQSHGRITVMVSREYASLLEGVSYADAEVFNGPFEQINAAKILAKQKFKKTLISQIYGQAYSTERKTDSFCREAWRLIGLEHQFGTHSLLFDRRDLEREKTLIDSCSLPDNKPVVLLVKSGNSSPFPEAQGWFESLPYRFPQFHFLDISNLKAHRFYDLLGLFGRSSLLISIDTGHLHLARASTIPVLAFVTDRPTRWHGAVPPPNTRLAVRYGEFSRRIEEVNEFLADFYKEPAKNLDSRRIFHVYSDYPSTGDTFRRDMFARKTWENEYKRGNWVHAPVYDKDLNRSSKLIGDTRSVPFIKDLVDKGSELALGSDLIVLTNADTCFCSGLTEAVLNEVTTHQSVSAHRWDFNHPLYEFYTPTQAMGGNWYCGCDLFAFTKDWWVKHRSEYPDMLLGTEAWDWILRELIKKHGGSEWNHPMIYHEFHSAYWYRPDVKNSNPAQLHNKRVAVDFLKRNKLPLNEFSGIRV